MTKPTVVPPAKYVHVFRRDTHGRFRPERVHRFPEKPMFGRSSTDIVPPRTDFPGTGTPEAVLHQDKTDVDIARSERVEEGASPTIQNTEWIEPEQEDWLDKDASR